MGKVWNIKIYAGDTEVETFNLPVSDWSKEEIVKFCEEEMDEYDDEERMSYTYEMEG